MQLKPEQLSAHLRQSLAPVYLVAGDEPLQVMEAAEQIRAVAEARGFSERDILVVDTHFQWEMFIATACALSLFAQRKVIDLRLANAKPGQAGSQALQTYLKHLPQDKILLMQTGRLDKAVRNTAWVKAIDKHGVLVNVWDLSAPQTVAWVSKRMQAIGLQANTEAIRYFSECIEGNLLAAQQEIQKLHLLYGNTPLEVKHIAAAVMDNARYSIFDLAEAILQRDSQRICHVLQILQAEGTALPLLVWALGDVIRQSYDFVQTGLAPRATPLRREALQRAAGQLRQLNWPTLFRALAQLEMHSKGVGENAPKQHQRLWDEVSCLSLACAGINLLTNELDWE